MVVSETLGVVAHPGGLLVDRPELSVGVSLIVSRPTGLEIRLAARHPAEPGDVPPGLDEWGELRPGPAGVTPAPRVLLPEYDEGMHLRVGSLDPAGRAQWVYGSTSVYSGRYVEVRTTVVLPPVFDYVDLVLAWPEIGFPEAVIGLSLPGRATVQRGTFSVWEAPPVAKLAAGTTPPGDTALLPEPPLLGDPRSPRIEAGRLAADPCVLVRDRDAVIVLSRVTRSGPILALEVESLARGEAATRLEQVELPHRDDFVRVRPTVALLHGASAFPLRAYEGGYSGGAGTFHATEEFAVASAEALDLLVAWPAAGIPAHRAVVPLNRLGR
ncbi:hypothetical protein [Paractinoplanes atraurantiacus]|uniref:Uncharacterized protein n=1 Tax=Paractinoplanes atraurantiacus TaxID=1036182 RepID=A0A285I910_9ACTN|nr:hypothetical protein [Actinoplanes atraurantiacus]SNY44470.1 hypothetical protein SAMN05421748_10776 [Actinoplanes atraurantiacus]